jgi:hypothetical protein
MRVIIFTIRTSYMFQPSPPPPGQLQEEQFLYTKAARIWLCGNMQPTSHSAVRELELAEIRTLIFLPEDDPAGLKHVGGSYSENNNTHCAFVGDYFLLCDIVHGYGAY